MKLLIKPLNRKLASGTPRELEVLVRAVAPQMPREVRRSSLCIVPLVDVSSSMEGSKLAAVKDALRLLIEQLVPGDMVGLVAFSDQARVVAPLREASESGKQSLLHAVRELKSDGNTNLGGALIEGGELVRKLVADTGARARLVVLTDGLANAGPATTAPQLIELVAARPGGASLSCFGYGKDCDHVLLSQMAGKGRGSFAFIRDRDTVLTAFAQELGGLLSTYASSLVLSVTDASGRCVSASLGDLLYENDDAHLFTLELGALANGRDLVVGKVHAKWRDPLGREQHLDVPLRIDAVESGQEDGPDADVLRFKDEAVAAAAIERAEAAARAGDLGEARAVVARAAHAVRGADLAGLLRDVVGSSYSSPEASKLGASVRGEVLSNVKKQRTLAQSDPSKQGNAVEREMVERFKRKPK